MFLVPEASTPSAVLAPEALVAPVPPLAIGNALLTLDVKSIEPANIAFVIPDDFTLKESELISIEESSTFTDKVFADLFNPKPAVICPAPEN